MIVTSKRETYDGKLRSINYAADAAGTLVPRLEKTFADDEIPQYFEQQEIIFQHLLKQLLAGEISPLAFYVGLTRMTVKDVAARMGLRAATVQRHLTRDGFAKARVRDLEGYARLFDIAVGDFFHFVFLDPHVTAADLQNHLGRLLQTVRIRGNFGNLGDTIQHRVPQDSQNSHDCVPDDAEPTR